MPNSTRLEPVTRFHIAQFKERRGVSSAMRCPSPRSSLFAEIGLAHRRIGTDRGRVAGRDDAAIDQDADAIRQREHRIHVVLDQEDRDARL